MHLLTSGPFSVCNSDALLLLKHKGWENKTKGFTDRMKRVFESLLYIKSASLSRFCFDLFFNNMKLLLSLNYIKYNIKLLKFALTTFWLFFISWCSSGDVEISQLSWDSINRSAQLLRVWIRSRTSGGINTWSLIRFCSADCWLELEGKWRQRTRTSTRVLLSAQLV